MKKIIYVDVDGTICNNPELPNFSDQSLDYSKAEPLYARIDAINDLYDEGHNITYWTARGCHSGNDFTELTRNQLDEWGCKYHKLSVGEKPAYDLLICDKTKRIEEI